MFWELSTALQQLETQLQSRKAEVEEYELENVEKQSHLREKELQFSSWEADLQRKAALVAKMEEDFNN